MMLGIFVASLLSCGTERWGIKTLSDLDTSPESDAKAVDASDVRFDQVLPATVSDLRSYQAPEWNQNLPRQTAETAVYRVEATLVGAKLEADQDFHIVIADLKDSTKTMIVEIPAAACLKSTAPNVRARVVKARGDFLNLFPHKVSASFFKVKKPTKVAVEGVAFFDKLHGQTGVAPNGIELHPVLSISVVP